MRSISRVGIAVISGFLLICHFCTFVSCQETQETCEGKGCTWDDQQRQCNCAPAEVQRRYQFLVKNQQTKIGSSCGHIICKSTGDPHITTFSGKYYHNYKVGVYTLVKLNSRSLWIQARQNACSGRSCNCGVMAREGNSVLGIDICNQGTIRYAKYRLSQGARSGSIQTLSDSWWKINLLSGIEIEVVKWDGKYLDLYIKGLKSEFGQYRGLCSVNNVPHDTDCPYRNCEQYRVPGSYNLFEIHQSNRPNCGNNWVTPACGCAICAQRRGLSIKGIDYRCDINKRQFDEENEVFEDKDNIPDDSNNDNTDSDVVARGLNMGYRFFGRVRALNPIPVQSVEDGRKRCTDALRLTPTYELCSGKVDSSTMLQSCALDEKAMKEDGPAKSIATEFETVCLDNIRLSIEADANSQELKDLLAKVEKLVCPSQCSQNGKCVDSKCQCNEGFTGTDCSQRIGQAPVDKERRESSNCDDGSPDCI